MKKVEAILPPFKLDEVKAALSELGVKGMTVSEVRRYGDAGATQTVARSSVFVPFIPKMKIEIVAADTLVDEIVEAIRRASPADEDDKIVVAQVDHLYRIRTGEHGEEAL